MSEELKHQTELFNRWHEDKFDYVDHREEECANRWESWCAALRAQLPSQGGEAVEVVAWRHWGDQTGLLCDLGKQRAIPGTIADEFTVPLMTVAQHQRIMAASVAGPGAVAVELKAMLARVIDAEFGFGEWPSEAELRALLANSEGVKP